jgi:two-component system, NtrC family, sensor kinase
MSLSGKSFSVYACMLALFGILLSWMAVELGEFGDTLTRFHSSVLEIPRIIQSKRAENRTLNVIVSSASPERMPDLIEDHIKKRTNIEIALVSIIAKQPFPVQNNSLKNQVPRLARLDRKLNADFSTIFKDGRKARAHEVRRLKTRLAVFDQALELISLDVQRSIDESVFFFRRRKHELSWSFIWAGLAALIFGFIALFVTQRLFAPLSTLKDALTKASGGDFTNRIPSLGDDEFATIAREFNNLAETIARRNEQLQTQQARLLQREQLATVGKMSAQITHELRNPLSSIGLNSELLLEELGQDRPVIDLDASQELLRNITKEVDRLRDITEEYLQFSRLPRPEMVALRLDLLGLEILEFMGSELAQAEVKWRVDAERTPRLVSADPNQLRSAIINLLRNAKEATGPGGHIVIRTRTVGNESRLEVIDDGPGITPEVQAQLFAPFYSTKPQGTGLGLAMVRQIMEAQGGQVTLESKVNEGTTVRLSLLHTPIDENPTTIK